MYTADSTPEMDAAIQAAADESTRTCEVCGAPGELRERNCWWAPRCKEHENWRRGEGSSNRPRLRESNLPGNDRKPKRRADLHGHYAELGDLE